MAKCAIVITHVILCGGFDRDQRILSVNRISRGINLLQIQVTASLVLYIIIKMAHFSVFLWIDLSVMNYDILSRTVYFLSPCVILLNRVLEKKVLYL